MKYSKRVKERIPSSYKFIRNIFKERSSGDENTERTIDLYYSDETGKYYLYYEYWVFSSQFAAGSIPLDRFYLEISEEDSKASDEEMIQLVNSILYPAKSHKKEYIDDITYIKDMRHSTAGPFHQYDVLLYAQPYGWAYMVDAADHLLRADLKDVTEVKTGDFGTGGYDITDSYHEHGDKIKDTPQLKLEQGFLSVAGTSAVIAAPVKVVWVNQTRAMRIFTLIDDELLIKKYSETVIRRSFGTQDAMKLGKNPEEQGSNEPDQPKQHTYTYTYKYTFNQEKETDRLKHIISRDSHTVSDIAEYILNIDSRLRNYLKEQDRGDMSQEAFAKESAAKLNKVLEEIDTEVYVDVINELAGNLKKLSESDMKCSVVPALIDAYELRMQDVLREQAKILRSKAIKKELSMIVISFSTRWVDGFLSEVEKWVRYADPLIKVAAARGTENDYVNETIKCLKDLLHSAFKNYSNSEYMMAKAFDGYFSDIPSVRAWLKWHLEHEGRGWKL